jgi:phage-related protein
MIFNLENLTSYNAVLLSKGEKQKPKKIYHDYGTLPGSSTTYYEDTGQYESYQRTIVILLKDRTQETALHNWLDGYGKLSIDDGGYYKARVLDIETETEDYTLGWVRKTVTFEVQPFFFLFTGDDLLTLTSGGTVVNPGLVSDPYIKITGSGAVALTVNGVVYDINPVDAYIEIEFPYAWKLTANKGRTLLDGFPRLQPGNNVISWSGTVTSVELAGRWRTL